MQGRRAHVICLVINVVLSIFIASCTTLPEHPRHGTSSDQMHDILKQGVKQNQQAAVSKHPSRLPHSVTTALLPPVDTGFPTAIPPPERRFDISANNVPAKAFFMGLVEGTPYNMVVSPNVTGNISLNLKKVTIDEAMDAVRDVYGYEYRRTSYGYEVLPLTIQSQIFRVNYLDIKRTGKSHTELSSGQISERVTGTSVGNSSGSATPITASTVSGIEKPSSSTVDTRSVINFWKDLDTTLKSMIGTKDGHSVVTNPQSGIVIVKAYPPELRQVSRFIDSIQTSLNRQVILEAKILEVQLNDQFQAGIDWNLFGHIFAGNTSNWGVGQQSSQDFNNQAFSSNLNDFASIFTLQIVGNFGTLIKMLQTQGTVQVLSSPRISTVNNQKAVIKVGTDEFFVTGVSTSNIVVGNSTIPTQDVGLTPFFSGITLDVTPQISSDSTVVLHIHPSISLVVNQTKNINLGTVQTSNGVQNNTLTLPLAKSTIRESDNVVRAKNGQIVVIGGLMQNNMIEDVGGVPGLSDLPFIGPFFRRTQQVSQKSELVILLRPVVVDRRTLENDFRKTDQTFQNMNLGFHSGSLPKVFGNRADTTQWEGKE